MNQFFDIGRIAENIHKFLKYAGKKLPFLFADADENNKLYLEIRCPLNRLFTDGDTDEVVLCIPGQGVWDCHMVKSGAGYDMSGDNIGSLGDLSFSDKGSEMTDSNGGHAGIAVNSPRTGDDTLWPEVSVLISGIALAITAVFLHKDKRKNRILSCGRKQSQGCRKQAAKAHGEEHAPFSIFKATAKS